MYIFEFLPNQMITQADRQHASGTVEPRMIDVDVIDQSAATPCFACRVGDYLRQIKDNLD